MQTVNKRNTETFEQAIKDLTAKVMEQQIVITGLTNTIGTLNNKLNELESLIMILKIRSVGTGPSVK